ncbi:hypothetical protein F5884DRAFT_889553 [Xylogone sp. PMI_703]|nr:hypothetical protein F5884DRAFT_889553 [Xylogone sp. PMI_703]
MCIRDLKVFACGHISTHYIKQCEPETHPQAADTVICPESPVTALCPRCEIFRGKMNDFKEQWSRIFEEIKNSARMSFSHLVKKFDKRLDELELHHTWELRCDIHREREVLEEGSRLMNSLFRVIHDDIEKIICFWTIQMAAVEAQLASACRMHHEEGFNVLLKKMIRCQEICKQELEERLILAAKDAENRWHTTQRIMGHCLEKWNRKESRVIDNMESAEVEFIYSLQTSGDHWDPWV